VTGRRWLRRVGADLAGGASGAVLAGGECGSAMDEKVTEGAVAAGSEEGAPMPSGAEPLEVEAGGLIFRGWSHGSGAPVVALHGWLDNVASMGPMLPYLAGAKVVACDLAGHGWSGHRGAGARRHVFDDVADLYALVEALGLKRFRLVGHSLGGIIGSLFAGAFPERVEALLMIDSFGPFVSDAEEAPGRLAGAIRQWSRIGGRSLRPFASFAEGVEKIAGDRPLLSQESARLLAARALVAGADGLWRVRHDPLEQLAPMLRLGEAQVAAFFGRINCPVTFVRAQQGWPVAAEVLSQRVSYVGRGHYLEVEGGHHVHMDHPERLLAAWSRFLAS